MDNSLPQAPAGEFVMFTSKTGKVRIECRFESETLWLSQAMIAELYGKAKATISEHISNIFKEDELDEDSVVRFFRTTASDGKNYQVQYFSLPLVLAVGYMVRSARGTQFRQWATHVLKFFQLIQNKLLLACSRKTATVIIYQQYFLHLLQKPIIINPTQPPRLSTMRNLGGFFMLTRNHNYARTI